MTKKLEWSEENIKHIIDSHTFGICDDETVDELSTAIFNNFSPPEQLERLGKKRISKIIRDTLIMRGLGDEVDLIHRVLMKKLNGGENE